MLVHIIRAAQSRVGVGLRGVNRLRKRDSSISLQDIARTVSGPAETEDEVHGLWEALLASGGRLAP